MRQWFKNVYMAVYTVAQGMSITLSYFFRTYKSEETRTPSNAAG